MDSSKWNYPQSLTVNLKKTYRLGDLSLSWDIRGGQRYYTYYVSVSEDGTNFTDIIDRRDNTVSDVITDSLLLTKASKIKITVTGCNQAGWASIFEIKANGYSLTSDSYTVDDQHCLIIVDNIPDTGLADSTFNSNLKFDGNYSYRVNYSSGWIHEGNTVDILDQNGDTVTTYTICTEATKSQYAKDTEVAAVVFDTDSINLEAGKTQECRFRKNGTTVPLQRSGHFVLNGVIFVKLPKALYRLSHTTPIHFNSITMSSVCNA